MTIRKCLVLVIVGLLLCTAQANAEQVRFWIQDLGVLGDPGVPGNPDSPPAYSINDPAILPGIT